MVSKLPSTRCLSKASREGDLSENMANADISASVKGISTSALRSSGMVAKLLRTKRKRASADRCLRPFGATMDIAPSCHEILQSLHRFLQRLIVASMFTKSQRGDRCGYWV